MCALCVFLLHLVYTCQSNPRSPALSVWVPLVPSLSHFICLPLSFSFSLPLPFSLSSSLFWPYGLSVPTPCFVPLSVSHSWAVCLPLFTSLFNTVCLSLSLSLSWSVSISLFLTVPPFSLSRSVCFPFFSLFQSVQISLPSPVLLPRGLFVTFTISFSVSFSLLLLARYTLSLTFCLSLSFVV